MTMRACRETELALPKHTFEGDAAVGVGGKPIHVHAHPQDKKISDEASKTFIVSRHHSDVLFKFF